MSKVPNCSPTEFIRVCQIYVIIGSAPLTLSVAGVARGTNLSATICRELIKKIDDDLSITTEHTPSGAVRVLPDKYLRRKSKVKEVSSEGDMQGERRIALQVDEVVTMFRAKSTETIKVSYAEKAMITSLAKEHSWADIMSIVKFALEDEFWKGLVKHPRDLFKRRHKDGKMYFLCLKEQSKKKDDLIDSLTYAQM